jgi:hypothetical protein
MRKMKNYLNKYIRRMRDVFSGVERETAHQIVFAMMTFKMGLYEDTIQRCTKALSSPHASSIPPVLVHGLEILRQRATDLSESRVRSPNLPEFSPREEELLPIPLSSEIGEDPAHLKISNSIVLLYVAGFIASPDDQEALEEQERYILKILENYKNQLHL